MSDDEFLARFEDGTLPNAAFRHRDHIRMTWLYLRREGFETGARRVRDGIRRFAAAKGATMLYHETLTSAWIHLVAAALEDGDGASFDAFTNAHPELLDKQRPWLHYRAETLAGAAARGGWVEPDRAPLPAILRGWTPSTAAPSRARK